MKKLFAIFIVVFALGACSSSDDDGNNSSNSQITPPSWIQGTWAAYYSEEDEGNGYPKFRFSHNEFCYVLDYLNYEYCLSSFAAPVIEEQIISESKYSFTIYAGNIRTKYEFKRVSETKIVYVNGSFLGDVTLIKQ